MGSAQETWRLLWRLFFFLKRSQDTFIILTLVRIQNRKHGKQQLCATWHPLKSSLKQRLWAWRVFKRAMSCWDWRKGVNLLSPHRVLLSTLIHCFYCMQDRWYTEQKLSNMPRAYFLCPFQTTKHEQESAQITLKTSQKRKSQNKAHTHSCEDALWG